MPGVQPRILDRPRRRIHLVEALVARDHAARERRQLIELGTFEVEAELSGKADELACGRWLDGHGGTPGSRTASLTRVTVQWLPRVWSSVTAAGATSIRHSASGGAPSAWTTRRADHGARSDRDEGSLLRRLMIKPVADARDEPAHALPAVRRRVEVGQPRRDGLGFVALDLVEREPGPAAVVAVRERRIHRRAAHRRRATRSGTRPGTARRETARRARADPRSAAASARPRASSASSGAKHARRTARVLAWRTRSSRRVRRLPTGGDPPVTPRAPARAHGSERSPVEHPRRTRPRWSPTSPSGCRARPAGTTTASSPGTSTGTSLTPGMTSPAATTTTRNVAIAPSVAASPPKRSTSPTAHAQRGDRGEHGDRDHPEVQRGTFPDRRGVADPGWVGRVLHVRDDVDHHQARGGQADRGPQPVRPARRARTRRRRPERTGRRARSRRRRRRR